MTIADHIGVIAEDLPEEVASSDHTGAPTGELVALSLAANRALLSKVVALEKANSKQTAQIRQLRKAVNSLQQKK